MTKKSTVKNVPAKVSREGLVSNEVYDTRKVVNTLEGLMTRVTQQDCTAETVNAACNCADKITDILRLHLEVERLRMRSGPKQ